MELTAEERFKLVVRRMAALHEKDRAEGGPINGTWYPSPSHIYTWLGRRSRHRSMNGRECGWRREVLEDERGWSYVGERHMYNYEPPRRTLADHPALDPLPGHLRSRQQEAR